MWRRVDGRNREICSAAPLVYYNVVRPTPAQTGSGERPFEGVRETGGLSPRLEAMGSNGGSDVAPAAAAATANEAEDAAEPSVVPSEAVPTPIEEEGELDPAKEKEIEDELLRELEVDRNVIKSELEARLGPSIEALTGLTPEKRADGESRHDFEVRVRSWLTDMETRNPPLISHAKVFAEGLIEGANRTDGLWEAFTCAKEKRKRLAKVDKDPPKKDSEAPPTEALRSFDVTLLLVAHQKESTAFYRGITKILHELKDW